MFVSKGDSCCGCMACVASCPKKVLDVKYDTLGFAYPFIKEPENCIECDRCNKACPLTKKMDKDLNVGEVLCAYHVDPNIRYKSSSGGVFRSICQYALNLGGVCYGAAFTEDFQVKHKRISTIYDFPLISGSKYVESSIIDCYPQVKKDLMDGCLVVFSGTPCQLHGLSSYLKKDYPNLIRVDLFCYGIPSPRVWEKWLDYISKGKRVSAINFRDKSYGWDDYSLSITFDDGTSYLGRKSSDNYIGTFSKGAYVRRSCYKCSLKAFPRSSDITLGDFQELKEIFPNEDPKNGWSMIKINTEKGNTILNAIRDELVIKSVTAETMNGVHPNIATPCGQHKNRNKLENDIDHLEIQVLLKKYARIPLDRRLKNSIKKVLAKL